MLPPTAKKEERKSETYKQAWTVSEQHVERLLTEIPGGKKNRGWSKISQATGGHRSTSGLASGRKPRSKVF
ncbi:hypothetical protein V8E53_002989 [Lactarius tabidus]